MDLTPRFITGQALDDAPQADADPKGGFKSRPDKEIQQRQRRQDGQAEIEHHQHAARQRDARLFDFMAKDRLGLVTFEHDSHPAAALFALSANSPRSCLWGP